MAENLSLVVDPDDVEEDKTVPRVYLTVKSGRRRRVLRDIRDLRLVHSMAALKFSPPYYFIPKVEDDLPPVSKTPLRQLRRISLTGLDLVKSTKGHYLLLRTLESAYVEEAEGCIKTIVEDHEGNVLVFSIWNMTTDPYVDVKDMFPIGTIFALKCPFSKVLKNACRTLECKNPSDIVFLHEGDPLYELVEGVTWMHDIVDPLLEDPKPSNAVEWKTRGDDMMDDDKFHLAIRCYLLALKQAEEHGYKGKVVRLVELGLSNAYLRRGYFELCLKFAKRIMKFEEEKNNMEALMAAGKSCYQLRKYDKAVEYFRNCHEQNTLDSEVETEFLRAKARLDEHENGQYDVLDMLRIRQKKDHRNIDCADYMGPVLILQTEGKGRGIVARCDIPPGTLVAVSKALSFALKPPPIVRVPTPEHETQAWEILAVQLGEMLAKNPVTFGPVLYELHPGRRLAKQLAPVFCVPVKEEEPIVDLKRLKAIININVTGDGPHMGQFQTSLTRSVVHRRGCGLFQLPSYFNHNCVPNASVNEYNNVMFIRTIKPLKAREEVFVSYVSWEVTLSMRLNYCMDKEFLCKCWLCCLDSQLPKAVHEIRADISNQYENDYQKLTEPDVQELKNLIKKIHDQIRKLGLTYKPDEPVHHRAALSPMYALLCQAMAIRDRDLSKEFEIDGHKLTLKFLGFDPPQMLRAIDNDEDLIPPEALLDASVLVSISRMVYLHMALVNEERAKAVKWFKILLALEKIYSGGNLDTVRLMYIDIKELMDRRALKCTV